MKLNEINEGLPAWLGSNLKSFARGAGAFVRGATGTTGMQGKNWLTGATNPANTFAQDFAQRIGKKIRNAVGAGNVDITATAPLKTTGKPWEWISAAGSPVAGQFKSGNTGKVYQRTPPPGSGSGPGSWKEIDPRTGYVVADYGNDTSQAGALDKKWSEFMRTGRDRAAGDMPDLTESKFRKLNALFERIMQEAEPSKHSLASMLQELVRIDVGASAPLNPTEQAAIARQCLVAQQNYSDPNRFNKELFNLGKILYSFVSRKPTP